eukprot:scaffold285_cov304-Pinguiococcus_pyrenoidosus.AAC.21
MGSAASDTSRGEEKRDGLSCPGFADGEKAAVNSPSFHQQARLGDLVTAEQAFALLEALTSLDRADVHDDYIEETLDELAEIFGASIADIFQVRSRLCFARLMECVGAWMRVWAWAWAWVRGSGSGSG